MTADVKSVIKISVNGMETQKFTRSDAFVAMLERYITLIRDEDRWHPEIRDVAVEQLARNLIDSIEHLISERMKGKYDQ